MSYRQSFNQESSTGAYLAGAQTFSYSSGAGYSNSAVSGSVSQIAQDLLQFSNSSVGSSFGSFGGAATQSASFGASAASAGSSLYVSQIEAAILAAQAGPININETEEISVLGNRGIWANKAEVVNWKGVIPIEQYVINEDSNPEVINKKVQQQLEYVQELAIRYLRPPSPPAPGEIVIKQEGNTLTPPAPPLVIRQVPARAPTPEPLVVREAPPQPPKPVGRKLITIGGKRLPPPPRKVVVERLAPLPSKPQSVIIERWLPYSQVKRRVIFQKSTVADPVVLKTRNVVVQWQSPKVVIKKDIKYLGVIRASPAEYVAQYGASLKLSKDLPQFVLDVQTPEGLVLAADHQSSSLYELEGDVAALHLVDLEREGLAEYKAYLAKLGLSAASLIGASSAPAVSTRSVVEEVFRSVNANYNGKISVEEAEKIVLRIHSKLGRAFSENDAKAFFKLLNINRNGSVDLDEFKKVFFTE